MPVNPNIALGVKPLELANPMNAMLQATQLRQSQMQMEAYQRERDALSRMQAAIAEKGGPADLGLAADEMLKSGVPHFMDMGFKIKEKLQRQRQLSDILGGGAPVAPSATPAAPVAGEPAAPVNAMTGAPAPYAPVVPRNAMVAPAGAAPTVDTSIQDTYRKIDQLHAIGEHELAKSLEQRVKDKLPPTMVQEYKFAQTPEGGGFKGTFETFKTLQAPKTTVTVPVNVSTEKKYGERFGGLIADADAAKLSAAEGAPAAAANADRITDLIATGKVITGTGANARLQIAKALNLAGGTDSEKIKNTEVLISSLAETTLGAIKSSNLGAGQGFTNADRDFLEKAKAGQITYDSKSLAELARLSRLAAEKSAESWNTRVKQIPSSALEGTGISTAPVVVPPRKTSSVMNIPADAINALKAGQGTAEQFDAIFGAGSANRVLGKGK